jgi:hypothetical protein
MVLLDGALALIIILAGTALLSPHHVLMLTAGLVVGAVALLMTHGRVVLRRRREQRVPVAAGRVPDVVPAEPLAVTPTDDRTAAAVAFGAMGLFLFNAAFGALAIGLGVAALRRGTPGRWGRPGALTAIVLGVADFAVLAVLIAGRLSGDGFHWG